MSLAVLWILYSSVEMLIHAFINFMDVVMIVTVVISITYIQSCMFKLLLLSFYYYYYSAPAGIATSILPGHGPGGRGGGAVANARTSPYLSYEGY